MTRYRQLSGNKNMFPLKVAISGFFCFIGTGSCPKPKTEPVPITVMDKNMFLLPI
ncbi:hypothetical protein [Paenibacillus sp. Marseille-Q4541]|uniref:hypothetical protein n=1 Tax=Paenibacillus sp. Marseille-Q4541 TaxID=2831522 RepID=UPI001BA8D8DC|nr:hypothetical protein [Paenibacillus sp. Marseille-Q4541]